MVFINPMQPTAVENSGAPAIGSPQFWQRPYKVPAAASPEAATAQTIGIMAGHVRNASNDALVRSTAAGAVNQFAGLAGDTHDAARAIACAAWWWCKHFIKFVHHDFIIRSVLGESGHLQGLISPEVLVRMNHPAGDCAIFSECLGAFLTVHGIPYEFVTVAANPAEPDVYSHVYVYAVLGDGSRLPLDASHGAYPGWQVPSAHVTKRQVWDASGNPVSDRGSRFDGLHNYGFRGLGDVCTATDPDFDYYACYANQAPADDNTTLTINYPIGGGATTPAFVAPSQSSSQWAAFASSLAKMGFDLARINAIQPGTVVSQNGAILRQNPGYAVGSPTIGANLGTGGSNLLLFGALGLGALLVISGMKGR